MCIAAQGDSDGKITGDTVLNEIVQNVGEYADVLSAVPEIMDACVARYKQRLIESRIGGSPSGMAVIMPAKRPATLAEAKRLADELLSEQ